MSVTSSARGSRTSGVTVRRAGATESEPLDPEAAYTLAGYYYRGAPEKVGPLEAANGEVTVLTGTDGQPLDVTEVVARHLSQHAVTALDPGIGLSAPLPGPVHRNPEIQPLHGVSPDT
jgi:sulfur-oxidizing protein SoxB